MSTNAVATTSGTDWSVIEKVVIEGDLSKLSDEERVRYYRLYCESLQLNPATRPFEYLRLSGKLVLYARKDATEQLRKLHNVSVEISARERIDDIYVVTALARLPNGRTDSEIGAVSVVGLKGEALANAMMKATTKGKRRVTLSICGLGLLDESEIHSIPGAQIVTEQPAQRATVRETPQLAPQRAAEPTVDTATGEVVDTPKPSRLPDKLVLRLEELATEAGIPFEQMEQDAVERYEKRDYTWLTIAEATDYSAWLKALAEETTEAEQELVDA